MKYNEDYQRTRDIDWFCYINGMPIHIASGGDLLPDEVNDRKKLRNLQHEVAIARDLYDDNEIEYNENFLLERFGNDSEGREDYVESFRYFAKKGFISYYRTMKTVVIDGIRMIADEEEEQTTYHMVCKPKHLEKRPQVEIYANYRLGQELSFDNKIRLNELAKDI